MTSPKIDTTRVEHIAKLASLSLSPSEIEQLALELASIVAYFEELNELDTENVPATAHVQMTSADWRSDTLNPGLSHEAALSDAPRVEHDGFAVPTFVEGGS